MELHHHLVHRHRGAVDGLSSFSRASTSASAMLMKGFARNNTERRVLLNTIGPVWDGNEVWLLTAGGATFAAFPLWYASWFSALYLPLAAGPGGLIFRAVAFEYRGKVDNPRWTRPLGLGHLRRLPRGGLRRRRRTGR